MALSINIQAAKSHTKPTDTPKLPTGHITALQRGDPAAPTKNTYASFPNQKTLTSHPYNPTHREEPPQQRGTTNCQNTERPPQTQPSKQDEKAEKYQACKEQDKCPPSQTKEEEIGNLPDKEFQIMIVKMIQNLENKMELQINSLETKIEKLDTYF